MRWPAVLVSGEYVWTTVELWRSGIISQLPRPGDSSVVAQGDMHLEEL